MQPAVLFWCYRDPDLCRRRLTLLRHHDPDVAVYCLFGGLPAEAPAMAQALNGLIDDFWCFSPDQPAAWKWRHGDLTIAQWYRQRGHQLAWDHLFIVQWDMLIAAPVHRLLAGIAPDQLLLSGVRPVREVAPWWGWIKGDGPEQGPEYRAFEHRLRTQTRYAGDLFACLFIVVSLPRRFLERYAGPEVDEIGFLEYKLPSLAAAWGFDFWRDHPFTPWWASDPATRQAPPRARLLNAVGEELSVDALQEELQSPNGLRLFHPVRESATDEQLHAVLQNPAQYKKPGGFWRRWIFR